ncbi:MAG: efflux RND transporter periplasmic adaptor subunit [Labilithrix sp.]|nr:efflux RND transporter periplasmic adaptor subunit [Labilithrix sp.]
MTPSSSRRPRRAFVALLCIVTSGCRPAPKPERQRTAVKVAVVERAASSSSTRYSAHIEPATRVDVAFKGGGYVDTIAKVPGLDRKPRLLQEGDVVRARQELASLRKSDYAQRLDEARSAFEQAKASAEQMERDLERAEQLARGGSIGTAELEVSRTKLASARAQLAGASARVNEASTALADTTLRAPLDGIVLRRSVEVGVLASPGTVAFTIADLSSVKAIFAVPDTALSRVQIGAPEIVTTEAFPGETFAGRISRVSPSADPKSRVFEAEVAIPNESGRLKAGMVAALSLEAPAGPGADGASPPLVPLMAIVRAPGKARAFGVFVVEDAGGGESIARLREVKLGEYLGRVIPVSDGLGAGERIVVLGAGLLSDGEQVEIIP